MFKSQLPAVNVIISTIIGRTDSKEAQMIVAQVNMLLKSSNLTIVDNGNISNNLLGRNGLHLNFQGVGKFALNILKCFPDSQFKIEGYNLFRRIVTVKEGE